MSRKLWFALIALGVAIVAAAVAWPLRGAYVQAEAVAAEAAKTTCSCVHVGGRSLDACLADLPEDVSRQTQVTQTGNAMHASAVLGAVSADAVYDQTYGCRLTN